MYSLPGTATGLRKPSIKAERKGEKRPKGLRNKEKEKKQENHLLVKSC